MARLRWRVCTDPDCGTLVKGGGRCPTHRPKDTRPSAAQRGYDARWRATRARFLHRFPDCQWADCIAPATDVHHLDGLGPTGPAGYDETNLVSLCHSHHSRITGHLQPGGVARDGRRSFDRVPNERRPASDTG